MIIMIVIINLIHICALTVSIIVLSIFFMNTIIISVINVMLSRASIVVSMLSSSWYHFWLLSCLFLLSISLYIILFLPCPSSPILSLSITLSFPLPISIASCLLSITPHRFFTLYPIASPSIQTTLPSLPNTAISPSPLYPLPPHNPIPPPLPLPPPFSEKHLQFTLPNLASTKPQPLHVFTQSISPSHNSPGNTCGLRR